MAGSAGELTAFLMDSIAGQERREENRKGKNEKQKGDGKKRKGSEVKV